MVESIKEKKKKKKVKKSNSINSDGRNFPKVKRTKRE